MNIKRTLVAVGTGIAGIAAMVGEHFTAKWAAMDQIEKNRAVLNESEDIPKESEETSEATAE